MEKREIVKGRGAQLNTDNRFFKNNFSRDHWEGIDDWENTNTQTQVFYESAKTIINKVKSPDVGMLYSLNPYQGCEHGCIYCYARNTHEYWGYSAGIDFENKIIVKQNAPDLLKMHFNKKTWKGEPVSLSGNTDCYQPLERKYKLTRKILEVCLAYKNPVGIITKNALVLRDLDILQELEKYQLVSVYTSITSLNEQLRMQLEPRTTTYKSRLKILETLSKAGIYTGVMNAPIIFGINDQDSARVIQAVSDTGAQSIGYTIARFNGAVGILFRDWLERHFPDRAEKVWHYMEAAHGGQVNDARFGTRMRGEGSMALSFAAQFKLLARKYGLNKESKTLRSDIFSRPDSAVQLKLF